MGFLFRDSFYYCPSKFRPRLGSSSEASASKNPAASSFQSIWVYEEGQHEHKRPLAKRTIMDVMNMNTISFTWDDKEVASSFRRLTDSPPPQLAPASDWSSSTCASECVTERVPAHEENKLQKDASLEEWAIDTDEPLRRRVTFGEVEIRKYPIIPGNHPDCVSGPPLTMAWDHYRVSTYPVDEFEVRRRDERKGSSELRLGWWNRRCLLRRLGFSDADMKAAEESSARARKQRGRTSSMMKLSKLQEVQQAVMKRLGRALYPKAPLETKY